MGGSFKLPYQRLIECMVLQEAKELAEIIDIYAEIQDIKHGLQYGSMIL